MQGLCRLTSPYLGDQWEWPPPALLMKWHSEVRPYEELEPLLREWETWAKPWGAKKRPVEHADMLLYHYNKRALSKSSRRSRVFIEEKTCVRYIEQLVGVFVFFDGVTTRALGDLDATLLFLMQHNLRLLPR
jgi:hypothetical protein